MCDCRILFFFYVYAWCVLARCYPSIVILSAFMSTYIFGFEHFFFFVCSPVDAVLLSTEMKEVIQPRVARARSGKREANECGYVETKKIVSTHCGLANARK